MKDNRKMLRFVRAFLSKRKIIHTNMQILERCNCRCQICDLWQDRTAGAHLTAGDVRVISEKLNRIAPQIIHVGGGEPLMHPEVVDIVRTLSRHHFPVMISNGWYMTREMARALFAAGMWEISVSIDYADATRHDAQRGITGAYDRAVDALRVLGQNRLVPEQRVNLITVVMDDNLDDIEPLIRLAGSLNVTYLVTLHSTMRGQKSRRVAPSAISKRLLDLKKRYPDFVTLRGYIGRFTRAGEQDGISPCYAGKNLCNIDCRGDVSLCIDCLDQPVGNILTEPIDTLTARLREKHLANECSSCWTSCRGAIETLMYGNQRWANLRDYYQMTRPLPLTPPPSTMPS